MTYEENQEILLFEWCGIAAQSALNSANQLASFKSQFEEQQETIRKLNAQLQDLIAAKSSHETELLEKFCDVLNEKKAKIRDQQRLLRTAKVDPQKLATVKNSRKSNKNAAPSPPKSRKRKANNEPQTDEDVDDEDDGFEKMDVYVDQGADDSDQQDIKTPEDDDTETADEDDEVTMPQPKTLSSDTQQAGGGRGKSVSGNSIKNKSNCDKITKAQSAKDRSPKTPPPRRELPFPKKTQQAKPPAEEDQETASEDDEL